MCHIGQYISNWRYHAVSKLKPNTGEGSSALTSDHIVNAGDDFMCNFAFSFTLFVVHGSVPDCFQSSTIVPIPKGHIMQMCLTGQIFEVSALSSLFSRQTYLTLLFYIDTMIYYDILLSSELQITLRICTPWSWKKPYLIYYKQHETPVFWTFHDASKAFGRLHYCKLFELLSKRQLPALIWCVFVN